MQCNIKTPLSSELFLCLFLERNVYVHVYIYVHVYNCSGAEVCNFIQEEEPLNSEDDVSDEDPTDLFDTDNVVVCQYDKVQ